jgi:hypothetical protein
MGAMLAGWGLMGFGRLPIVPVKRLKIWENNEADEEAA